MRSKRGGQPNKDKNFDMFYMSIFGDDFCISNPLGGASKGQTYTAIYMRILNCRAQYQKRQLDTILVMMCPNQFNKRLRSATRPIASCLQRLSKKGFEVEIEGEKRRICQIVWFVW